MPKVKLDQATARQLRWHLQDKTGIEIHKTASAALIRKKLEECQVFEPEFEVPDQLVDTKEHEAEPRARFDETAILNATMEEREELIVRALVESGMPRDQALALVGSAPRPRRSGSVNPTLPTGPGAEKMWCTIVIAVSEQQGGDQPVPAGVNGVVQFIPRGKECEVRVPFVEVLMHAQEIVYDPVMEPDGINTRLVPRVVQSYPLQYCSEAYRKEDMPQAQAA